MNITSFDLEKWYVKYEFSSKYNLSTSGIRPLNLNNLEQDDSFKNLTLTYSPANGNQKLVEIIARINNADISEVLVTNGAIEALFLAQLALINKGDKVVVVKPTYPALYQIAEDIGAEIIDWELDFANGYKPDLNKLEELLITYKPKMLVINFPNNPTGVMITETQLKNICELAEKHNCYLMADEVYKNISPEALVEPATSIAFNYYKNSISINSLSKAYGLAGLRIGWMIANPEIISKCMNLRHYTSLCNNILGEYFATNVLNNSKKYLEESNQHAKHNYDITIKKLDDWKKRFNIDYVKPETGVMLFIKMNDLNDTEKFCVDFEKASSILLLPGNKYGEKYKQFIRLGFGGNTESLIYCLDKLEEFLNSYSFN